jgi:hypothetical protein
MYGRSLGNQYVRHVAKTPRKQFVAEKAYPLRNQQGRGILMNDE